MIQLEFYFVIWLHFKTSRCLFEVEGWFDFKLILFSVDDDHKFKWIVLLIVLKVELAKADES